MKIESCKVNHLTKPLGYSMDGCVFSWLVEEAAGKAQTAARIVVRRGDAVAADTGWADLDSLAAPVAVELRPRTRYTWTVSVRTEAGEEATSGENWFETGKMEEPWSARWIGCDDGEPRHPVFSREIRPDRAVASARLYVCGLGLYETRWNGEKLGDEYLTPYCNNYDSWVQYQTYDVTAALQSAGTLSVTLGNGWYKGRFGFARDPKPHYGESWKLIAEVRVLYTDGSEEVIGTDERWNVTRSNIFFSNIYDGEQRDDTLPEIPPCPAVRTEAPKGTVTARYSTPVTVSEELPVKELIRTPAGETVLDIGQNMAGSFRLRVDEPAGTKIRLQFGEILQNGNFYRDNLRSARAEYLYISDGKPHVLTPKFTFYGYRYVKVEGVSDLKPEDFTALVLHSALPRTGSLTTGNALVNQLISNVEWGQRGNSIDVPTDCPQRDERMGWTGDAQVFTPTACFQRDSYAFFRKYLHDVWTEQQTRGGMVPDVIPDFGVESCSAAWGDAACVIPWTLYRFYGDRAILEDQFASMAAWVDYITRVDGDDMGWRTHTHYGDWLALDADDPENLRGGTDVALVADAQYLHVALLTAKAARVLGRDADAANYEALAETLRDRIRHEFFTPSGRCAVPTQTGLLLALRDGIAPDPARCARDLEAKLRGNEGRLRTGFVGTPLLCPTLTATGRDSLAFDLLLNEDYPGWLYAVKLGATTIWERWNSVLPDGSISDTGMNSLNHYSYGSIAAWLYRDVAGLAPDAPGFRSAILKPHLNVYLGSVGVRYASAAGVWEVSWEILPNGDVSYRCAVPFGCTARLTLPCGGGEYALSAGVFEKTYTPDRPLRTVYSTDSPISDLLANARVKAALVRAIPQITQLPDTMRTMSMRQLAALTGTADAEQFEMLDAMLAGL